MTLKVCHIAEGDGGGGALLASRRLHATLKRLGVASGMCVARRTSGDPAIRQIQTSRSLGARLLRRAHRDWQSIQLARYNRTKSITLEIFSQGAGSLGRDLVSSLPDAEVYNLHWTSDLVDYHLLFRHFGKRTSVAWRLPDQNPMTGGCHFVYDCDRFTSQCGRCPQLGSNSDNDLASRVFQRKLAAVSFLDPQLVSIIAPSNWIASQARRSKILGRFDVVRIPTGVDIDVFQPRDKAIARDVLGLPPQGNIVLFGAASVSEYRKGFDLLFACLPELQAAGAKLVALGAGGMTADSGEIIHLGQISNARLLSYVYSAADLFVLPTRADNLPNVALEAMACGVPVVSFDVGGMSDIIKQGVTGLLAPSITQEALLKPILQLLADGDLRRRMGMEARRLVCDVHDSVAVARQYDDVYTRLIDIRHRIEGALAIE